MAETVTLSVNGNDVSVAAGSMVSAAISAVGETAFRTSVEGEPRGPLCGMGICFECRVSIDGVRHVRACQRLCQPGMQVRTHD
ncbi:MAG: (2Fe-2S)-binding protein [Planctomycetaceae bacterium]|jgi:D-hydroxyproline dehydrogenase subunit gamma|nr:(2Fe-2S)-binding protein [Planctomycetaceae bacterium]MBT6484151.1 (2Fe-2S)-binding protein [Planctomycetaceae bacterium]MBT6495224.1 (2Fe-2S)-binding protein [Planctomycetaceae bacterium]